MYDIRQFKPTLYCLLLLAILGFSLAAELPALWVLGTAAVVLNIWLAQRGMLRPLPRIASNLITIGAIFLLFEQGFNGLSAVVLLIGEFLMLLMLVKLWEQRGNRDYAQLLVLSLLLMVAAAINTANLFFGLILVVFLFIALYCCLLFHLKVESEAASRAMDDRARKINPALLRQDQRHLTASMRKITLIVSTFAIVIAAIVFIAYPRGAGAGMLGPPQFKATQTLVGFTDDVSFQNIARIQQNEAQIGTVKLWRNGRLLRGETPLLLRGVTLDTYTGREGGWRWVRWPRQTVRDLSGDTASNAPDRTENEPIGSSFETELTREAPEKSLGPQDPDPNNKWVAQIQLQPTGTDVMFSIAGPYKIKALRPPLEFRFWTRDRILRYREPRDRVSDALNYEITASNQLGAEPPLAQSGTDPKEGGAIAKEIRDLALQPQVSGGDQNLPIAAERYARFKNKPADDFVAVEADDADEQIAENIEKHLRRNYAYTLDLTDTRRIEGRDPMVAFLYDFKKGHCEYFAGAMTLMCQSLGMKARMCCGFRCMEYNDVPGADYFIVRQSHAHVWVEVFTKKGWQTFDPTGDRDSVEQAKQAGLLQKIGHILNALQYGYGHAIIGYSNEDRTNVVQAAETALFRAAFRSSRKMDQMRHQRLEDLLASKGFWKLSSQAIAGLIALTAWAAVMIVARYLWEKWRLRKRAERIGIDSLPPEEQVRLARQLGFYDELMTLLARHEVHRLPCQTQLEFSQSLLFLPAEAYNIVARLTELFYRVRYGHAELTPRRQRHLIAMVEQVRRRLVSMKDG